MRALAVVVTRCCFWRLFLFFLCCMIVLGGFLCSGYFPCAARHGNCHIFASGLSARNERLKGERVIYLCFKDIGESYEHGYYYSRNAFEKHVGLFGRKNTTVNLLMTENKFISRSWRNICAFGRSEKDFIASNFLQIRIISVKRQLLPKPDVNGWRITKIENAGFNNEFKIGGFIVYSGDYDRGVGDVQVGPNLGLPHFPIQLASFGSGINGFFGSDSASEGGCSSNLGILHAVSYQPELPIEQGQLSAANQNEKESKDGDGVGNSSFFETHFFLCLALGAFGGWSGMLTILWIFDRKNAGRG